MVEEKSPSHGLDGSITPLSRRALLLPGLQFVCTQMQKIICLGLVACTGLLCPTNSM